MELFDSDDPRERERSWKLMGWVPGVTPAKMGGFPKGQ